MLTYAARFLVTVEEIPHNLCPRVLTQDSSALNSVRYLTATSVDSPQTHAAEATPEHNGEELYESRSSSTNNNLKKEEEEKETRRGQSKPA